MQHYGLPTRLLDWTESLLVAVFFAVAYDDPASDRPQDGDAVVYALCPAVLNERFGGKWGVFDIRHEAVTSLIDAAFLGGAVSDKVLAVRAPQIDARMMLQQSAFTIHGSGKPLEQMSGHEDFLLKFVIPRESCETLMDVLGAMGIDQSTLFPDLAHLAKQLDLERLRSLALWPSRDSVPKEKCEAHPSQDGAEPGDGEVD